MNKKYIFVILIPVFICFSFSETKIVSKILLIEQTDSLPVGLVKLKQTYPNFIDSIGENLLIWKDGTKMIYDDGINKINFYSLLNKGDLEDQMKMQYTKGEKYKIPNKNFDPGRIRNEMFFRKMYGATKKEVLKNLVTIDWLPSFTNKKLRVTKINNIHKKLILISKEFSKKPHLIKYLKNPGGTFYWRTIAGTERLSMHSFGNAIDINVKYSNYWRWSKNKSTGNIPYVNRIPFEIVSVFEKYGFIWGGKWYHYDTMHFEYRPELL